MKKIFITIALLFTIFGGMPVVTLAQQNVGYGLVRCDGVLTKGETERQRVCNFSALVEMVNYIVSWLFMLTIPIFIGILAYSGFLFMMPPSSGRRSQAKKMLWAALVGFVIMLSSWLIVSTLLTWLVDWQVAPGADDLIENVR